MIVYNVPLKEDSLWFRCRLRKVSLY